MVAGGVSNTRPLRGRCYSPLAPSWASPWRWRVWFYGLAVARTCAARISSSDVRTRRSSSAALSRGDCSASSTEAAQSSQGRLVFVAASSCSDPKPDQVTCRGVARAFSLRACGLKRSRMLSAVMVRVAFSHSAIACGLGEACNSAALCSAKTTASAYWQSSGMSLVMKCSWSTAAASDEKTSFAAGDKVGGGRTELRCGAGWIGVSRATLEGLGIGFNPRNRRRIGWFHAQ
jgi:hypothetical protein